jgi:hypothetical protein
LPPQAKRAGVPAPQGLTLKTQLGTEGDAQIVVRAAVKENIVANFRPHPDPLSERFNSSPRVNREIRRTIR